MPRFVTHKVIFIHIPKAAGTSIEHCFLAREDTSGVSRSAWFGKIGPEKYKSNNLAYNKGFLGRGARQHLTYSDLIDIGWCEEKDLKKNNWVTFSIVRDPWDKLVSAVFFDQYGVIGHKFHGSLEKCSSKEEVQRLFKSMLFMPSTMLATKSTWDVILSEDHFRTQSSYVKHKGKIAVDAVLRFESLEKDFNDFLINFGLNKKFYDDKGRAFINDFSEAPNFKIPKRIPKERSKKNFKSYKEHFSKLGINRYKDLYDNELRDFVADKYKEDIETFNYSF